jgi:sulfur relay (sulfurtransferase) complex TusBCD TusD component (DsrE family)
MLRGITAEELSEGARRSSMEELTAWTLEADKVITF